MSKRSFGTMKCLLHFDYPYYGEAGDGLGDEVGLETWSKAGNLYLAGTELPAASIASPKFSWRCAYFPNTSSYLTCTNNTGIWNLSSDGDYELEAFIKVTGGGNIFLLNDSKSLLSVTTEGIFTINWPEEEPVTQIAEEGITLNDDYHHVLLRISGGIQKLFVDGVQILENTLPSNSTFNNVTSFRIGGFVGYMDEFVFRHSAGTGAPKIPTQPYAGTLNIDDIGGFGTGVDGDVVISEDTMINSYGMIASVTDAKTFSVYSWTNGMYEPKVGSEVMIHVTSSRVPYKSLTWPYNHSINNLNRAKGMDYPYTGLYVFAKISEIDGVNVVLTTPIDGDFTLTDELLDTYCIQVITVPNFNSLMLKAGKKITTVRYGETTTWNDRWKFIYYAGSSMTVNFPVTGGGIIVFRCKNNCIINGNIITSGCCFKRTDKTQMENSKLIDKFLIAAGGGVFITCGGLLSVDSQARIGASWSGTGDKDGAACGYGGHGGTTLLSLNNIANDKEDIRGAAGSVGAGGGGMGSYTTAGKKGNTYTGGIGMGGTGGSPGVASNPSSTTYIKKYGTPTGGSISGDSVNGGFYDVCSDSSASTSSALASTTINCYYYKSGTGSAYTQYPAGGGGGAPGGSGGDGGPIIWVTKTDSGAEDYGTYGGVAGSCVVILGNKIHIQPTSISTGGENVTQIASSVSGSTAKGGSNGKVLYGGAGGGGGTGFCYIACKEQV